MGNKIISLALVLLCLFLSYKPAAADTCGVFQKKVNEKCIKFNVPSNAHLTYSGNSWDCNRGYKLNEEKTGCEEITVPSNATANAIDSFNCNSGFKKEGNTCVKVKEIENGRFYESGGDFYCLNGFKKNEDLKTCEKVQIPANAREDSSSLEGWRCFSGYLKEGNSCKEFKLPEHAFWFIDFWDCEPGYKKNESAKSCEKIKIPDNAHGTATFDGWLCNLGYTKNYRENRCDKI
jgi:hypothetical protein